MEYRNREILDEMFTEVSETLEVVDLEYKYLDFDNAKLDYLQDKLCDKAKELINSPRRSEGVRFKDLRIRIEHHLGDCDLDEDSYADICIVWDESESTEERSKRIEKAKAKIDKDIERYEKKKAEKAAKEEQRNNDELLKAMEILVKNGYTVTK